MNLTLKTVASIHRVIGICFGVPAAATAAGKRRKTRAFFLVPIKREVWGSTLGTDRKPWALRGTLCNKNQQTPNLLWVEGWYSCNILIIKSKEQFLVANPAAQGKAGNREFYAKQRTV